MFWANTLQEWEPIMRDSCTWLLGLRARSRCSSAEYCTGGVKGHSEWFVHLNSCILFHLVYHLNRLGGWRCYKCIVALERYQAHVQELSEIFSINILQMALWTLFQDYRRFIPSRNSIASRALQLVGSPRWQLMPDQTWTPRWPSNNTSQSMSSSVRREVQIFQATT